MRTESMTTKLDKRFFDSSRGRIVGLLRGTSKTVNELAEQLDLTDNAVRAHLLSLERDGLVRQSGVQRGRRKPHFAYELTDEGETLFPKAYDTLLNQLVKVLRGRLTPPEFEKVVREVGRSLADDANLDRSRAGLEARIERALRALEEIGGAARVERGDSGLVIKSASCPFAKAVSEHPEICQLTEAFLAEIIGKKLRERCEREGSPRCRFEIVKSG